MITCNALALTALLAVAACSNRQEGRDSGTTPAPAQEPAAAGTTDTAASRTCLNLVNGTLTSEYPAVVRLLSKPSATTVGICTGTFISPTAVLTAAHCLDGSTTGGLYLVSGTSVAFKSRTKSPFDGGIKSLKALTLGSYGETGDPNNAAVTAKDTAIVLFPPGAAAAYMALGPSVPPIGTVVTSIGYGLTTLSNAAADPNYDASKHIGTTKIVTPQDNLNVYVGGVTAQESAAANGASVIDSFGDSGGPLIYNNTVVATLSNGGSGQTASGREVWYVTFVDINSDQTKKLLVLANQNGAAIASPGTAPATIAAAKTAVACAAP